MSEAQKMAADYWEARAKSAETDLAEIKRHLILLVHDAISNTELWLTMRNQRLKATQRQAGEP